VRRGKAQCGGTEAATARLEISIASEKGQAWPDLLLSFFLTSIQISYPNVSWSPKRYANSIKMNQLKFFNPVCAQSRQNCGMQDLAEDVSLTHPSGAGEPASALIRVQRPAARINGGLTGPRNRLPLWSRSLFPVRQPQVFRKFGAQMG
jgi:hypothetical protein